MYKSYTISENYKITYEWEIKEFKNYLHLYENINYELSSSSFSPNKDDEGRFHLQLKFNADENISKKWLSYLLCWDKFDEPVTIECKLYSLNDEKEKCKESIFTITPDEDTTEWGIIQYYHKVELEMGAKQLLPNNTLTLGCDLIVYYKPINIQRIYERASICTIQKHLKNLLTNENGFDVIFDVDDQEIKAHKLILTARSPVFGAMFRNPMIEKKSNRIIITDIRPKVFQLMLEFIYTDEIECALSQRNAVELLSVASKYQLEGLQEICGEFLHRSISPENAMDVRLIAEQYNMLQLVTSVENFIKANQKEVVNTIFLKYLSQNPQHAISFNSKT